MMMDDQTKLIDEGTEAYPLDPGTAAGDESCPNCKTTIPGGEQFCPKCGYQRGTWREGETEAMADAAVVSTDAPFMLTGEGGMNFPLPVGETVIGRGEVEIVLDDNYASRRHAQFTVAGDEVAVADLGSANGTFIGERRLAKDETVVLSEGDIVRVGQTDLALKRAEPPAEADAGDEPPADVEVITADEEGAMDVKDEDTTVESADEKAAPLAEAKLGLQPAGSSWSLSRVDGDEVFYLHFGETKLGRKAGECDVVVRGDGYISGLHAKVLVSETTIELTDLSSTNGTFVNDEKLPPDTARQLGAGDAVRLGQTDLVVEYNELGEATSEMDSEPEEDSSV